MDPKARVDPLVPGAFLFAQVFIPGETLTQRPLPLSELQYSDQPDEEVTNVVAPGRPVGQMYGLGGVDFLDKDDKAGWELLQLLIQPKDEGLDSEGITNQALAHRFFKDTP